MLLMLHIIFYQCNEDTFHVVRLTSTRNGHKSTTDVIGNYKLENKSWLSMSMGAGYKPTPLTITCRPVHITIFPSTRFWLNLCKAYH